jgi:cytochrome P450
MTPSKLDSGIIVKDPPDHTRLRRLVAKAFTQRRVEQLRVRIRELAEELVDAVAARGMPVDLVEHFALSLPVVVICELLGVPAPDRPRSGPGATPSCPRTRSRRSASRSTRRDSGSTWAGSSPSGGRRRPTI